MERGGEGGKRDILSEEGWEGEEGVRMTGCGEVAGDPGLRQTSV